MGAQTDPPKNRGAIVAPSLFGVEMKNEVLWRENAERLISQWRPNIILEAPADSSRWVSYMWMVAVYGAPATGCLTPYK